MKKIIFLFLPAAALLTTACSKDRDETAKGKFTYQSTTYETNYATFVISGPNKDTAKLGFTKGLNTTGPVTGTGFAFVIGVEKTVPVGTFTFKNLRATDFDKTKNIFSSGVTVDYNWQTQVGVQNYLIGAVTSGNSTIVIKKSGDKYEITYDARLPDGKTFSGSYTGAVTVVQ